MVIPATIRRRYGLIPGTEVQVVDDGDGIRLVIRRSVAASTLQEGFGMFRLADIGESRRLSDFDPASLLNPSK